MTLPKNAINENEFKTKYYTYVRNLPLNEEYKGYLADTNFVEKNPIFYLYYPKLFSKVFNIDSKTLDKLCIAGYLFYFSVLQIDRVVDDNDTSSLALISIAQEEAIKILTDIFGLESEFWTFWNIRRSEYYEAVIMEAGLKQKKQVSFDTYSNLADLKSAFGKVAIDALHLLTRKQHEKEYVKLLESHRLFSIGLQINDDIIDFTDDIKRGQFNWAVQLMEKNGDSLDEPKRAKKVFYLKGYSNELFKLAINCIDEALVKINGINAPHWDYDLKRLKMKFTSSIMGTENYIEVLKAHVTLSTQNFKNNNIGNAVLNAINFIAKKQQTNGSWREYENQGGISNVWATAFILCKISAFKKQVSKINFENALDFLKETMMDHTWSYNETWIPDADSTALALVTLIHNQEEVPKKSIETWMSYKCKTEGFSTYNDKELLLNSLADKKISNVDGWVSDHQCVSAVSLYLSILTGQQDITDDLLKYFDNLMLADKIESYWWSSPIYTLHFLLKSKQLLIGKEDDIQWIAKKILSFQDEKGCFHDSYGENTFITGLAIEALMIDYGSYKEEIDLAVKYLLDNQFSDGSWENSHSLQVPAPSATSPTNNYSVSSYGTSVRAKEFNRLFSTVTNLSALLAYENRRIDS